LKSGDQKISGIIKTLSNRWNIYKKY
jgi:hypothetical protein